MAIGILMSGLVVGSFALALRVDPAPARDIEMETEPAATDALGGFLWRRHAMESDDGSIRPGGLARALEQRAANQAASTGGPTAGIDRERWVNRGPQNVGGRVRSLLIHPSQPDLMFAGSVSGGIFKTSDGGQHWTPVNDYLANLAISTMAMNPKNPRVLYAGTGEGFFPSDAVSGAGIFKSSDGGVTWQRLPHSGDVSTSVNRLAISPDATTILAGGYVFGVGGVLRSVDGGTTWKAVFDRYTFDVEFNPVDSRKALLTFSDYDSALKDTVHRVAYTEDGGLHWTTASGLTSLTWLGRVEVAYAPSAPTVVYATGNEAIYKSTDGGKTFSKLRDLPGSGLSWYCNSIWVAPSDPNLLVVGGGSLWRSTDGGVNFETIGNGYLLTDDPHPDHHRIVSAPGFNGTTNRRVYVTNDGGVFRTDDILAVGKNGGWVSLVNGLQTAQYYAVAGDGPRQLYLGGTQDNGTLRLDGGSRQASLVFGGDGGQSAIDWEDPRYCYGEYVGLRLFRSSDGCHGWSGYLDTLPDFGVGNWIAPLTLDPSSPRRLYAGGKSLWRTDDARADVPVWTAVRPPGSDNVLAIAVAPSDPNVVWVTQNDSRVYKTTNALAASPSWVTIDDNSHVDPLPRRWMPHILIDRQNPNRVWIGLGGYEDHNLWRTDNGGQTWTDVSGSGATGLPFVGVRSLAQHPTHPDWLYVATDVGVFATANGGQSWTVANAGPANVSTDDLTFVHGTSTLLLGTHGRGLWTQDTDAFTAGVPCVADANTLCLAAQRFRVFASWRTSDGQSGSANAVALTPDTGYFWFFDPNNVEMAVKVLDGCGINHRFWTFVGGLTNVEVTLHEVDTVTGATRTYVNTQGRPFAPIQDVSAFNTCGAGAQTHLEERADAKAPASPAPPSSQRTSVQPETGCGGSPADLCLRGGRFRASIDWTTPNGQSGHATGVPITSDTGYFWFFSPSNVEVLVKALDACGLNDHYWVFAGGLTSVDLTLRLTDTWTGDTKEYRNPQNTPFQPIQDTTAFETCQ